MGEGIETQMSGVWSSLDAGNGFAGGDPGLGQILVKCSMLR